MRTLNRPMFRYGGPIKEGVMHGIREPRRNGGSMGNQALLVGNPAFPMQNGRALHAENLQGIFDVAKNAAKKTITTNPLKVLNPSKKLKFIKNLATTGINPLKNFYRKQMSKLDMPPSFRSAGGEFKGAGTAGGGGIPLSLMDKIKYFGKANPKTTAAGVGVGLSSGVIPEAAGGIGSLALKGAKQAADLLVYDKIFDQDKWFADRDNKKKMEEINLNAEKNKLTANEIEINRLNKLLEQPEVPKKTDAESRAEQIAKYRDIVDIKGMNKDAAYDSLIAASQAINSSGDFKGDLKSGKLINQIIQGASKAYDKPKATKDAIDTLILKSEIQKDLNKDDKALANLLKEKQIEIADKTLKGDNMAAILNKATQRGTRIDETLVDGAYREATQKIPLGKFKLSEVNEFKEDNKGKNEIDYITKMMEITKVAPGDYIVGGRVVTVSEDNTAEFFF